MTADQEFGLSFATLGRWTFVLEDYFKGLSDDIMMCHQEVIQSLLKLPFCAGHPEGWASLPGQFSRLG